MPVRSISALVLGMTAVPALIAAAAPAFAGTAAPKVVASLAGPDGGWDYVTLDAANNRLLVARSAGVTVYDLGSGAVSSILPELKGTHIALPVNGGKDVLVTVGPTGEAVIADLATGAVRSRVKTGEKPDAAVFEPVSGLVWVMDNKGGGIALVNPVSGVLEGTIAVSGALEFAATDGKGRVFVNVEDTGELVALDARSRKVVGRYKLAGCEEPTGLAYDSINDRLFSSCANKVATAVTASTGQLAATLPIGSGPDAAVFDPVTHHVLIPSRDGKLTVIDADKLQVVATGETRTTARTAAIDVRTGRVYLPSAVMGGPPAKPGGRPTMTPGSFAVLTVTTR